MGGEDATSRRCSSFVTTGVHAANVPAIHAHGQAVRITLKIRRKDSTNISYGRK
jgi:hypothetical protein